MEILIFKKTKVPKFKKVFLILIFLFFDVKISLCLNSKNFKFLDEKLLFVGENTKIITIASKKIETVREAPAVAKVITAEEIQRRGFKTLAEVLSFIPGFYVEDASIAIPYIRGIPRGILFLYDGVPLTTDSTKAINPLGYDLSLEAISRIEIIKGPGSVLWGPDAYAAIVNLVPKRGFADNYKLNMGVNLSSPSSHNEEFLSYSFNKGLWSSYLFLSHIKRNSYHRSWNFYNFSGDVPKNKYKELVFNFNVANRFYFSSRISDVNHYYVSRFKNLSWPSVYNNPFSFYKINFNNNFGKSTINLLFYQLFFRENRKEFTFKTHKKNIISNFEFLFGRKFLNSQAYFAFGFSYRKNQVKDAVINTRGFLPYFLNFSYFSIDPLKDVADFNTKLYSFFSQYRHSLFKNFSYWFGIRYDHHNQYESTISYNLGCNFSWKKNYLKLLYGLAYRTPYSIQFLENKDIDPEKIRNFSLELFLQPYSSLNVIVTFFHNRIKDYINEDPFGGYSLPSKQKFWGTEFSLLYKTSFLKIGSNLFLLNHKGKKEKYKVLDYILVTPSSLEEIYNFYEKDFYTGAKFLGNAYLEFFYRNMSFFVDLKYIGDRSFVSLSENKEFDYPDLILFNVNFLYKFNNKVNLIFSIKNLFDKKFKVNSSYSSERTFPFAFFGGIKLRW